MADIELSFAIASNPRSRPIISGRVKPQGMVLHCSTIHASELFWRQLGYQEFELSEMSMSSLLIAISRGIDTFVGIPIFTTRNFFHTGVLVREDRGIDEPKDLAGKRVGVPEYQQTAALWARGILQHEYGVDPRDLHWFMERPPEKSHGGATGFQPPQGVTLEYIRRDTDMGTMLASGELDAALHYLAGTNNLVDRSSRVFGPGSGVRPLFDASAESARYFAKTGIYPVNHCVAIRRDVLEAHPWIPLNLYSAFLEAKQLAAADSLGGGQSSAISASGLDPFLDTGTVGTEVQQALAHDLFPYGVQANRELLETILLYSYEQGLSQRKLSLEDVFYAPTLEL